MKKPSEIADSKGARAFSGDEEEQKRLFYERMSPRRRRFVDRIGFENWDPFEAPKEPLDMRRDRTKRTAQELVRDFMKAHIGEMHGGDYARGATECAVGLVAGQEKFKGALDFCVWYHEQLKRNITADDTALPES